MPEEIQLRFNEENFTGVVMLTRENNTGPINNVVTAYCVLYCMYAVRSRKTTNISVLIILNLHVVTYNTITVHNFSKYCVRFVRLILIRNEQPFICFVEKYSSLYFITRFQKFEWENKIHNILLLNNNDVD